MRNASDMRRFNYRFANKEIEIVEERIENEAAKGKFSTSFVLNVLSDPDREGDNPDTFLNRIEHCIVSALVTADYKVTSALIKEKNVISFYIDWKNF